LPALSLSMDAPAPDIMVRKPRKRQDRLIDKDLLMHVGFNSVVITIGAIAMYFGYRHIGSPEKAGTLPFVSIILFQMFNIFNCRNPKGSILNRTLWKNPYVLGAVTISTLSTILIVSFPATAEMFHLARLSVADWAITALVAASIIVLNEIAKRLVFGRPTNRA